MIFDAILPGRESSGTIGLAPGIYQLGIGALISREPDRDGTLKHIKGALPLEIALDREKLMEVDLAMAAGKPVSGPEGMQLTARLSPTTNPTFLSYDVTGLASDASHRHWLVFYDAEGRRWSRPLSPSPAGKGAPIAGNVPIKFSAYGPPTRVILERYRPVRTELPFVLENVSLP